MKINRSFTWVLLVLFLGSLPSILALQKKDEEALRLEEIEDYFEKWLKEDVLYIVSDEEKAVFQKLTTPEEKEQFIEQFWLRRDPDVRTAINEFKEEHYRRIAYANEHFTSGDRGWMTDRGRVYIIHGEPDSIERRPSGGYYRRPMEEGGGSTATYPFEKWRYRYIEGLGTDIELEFVDPTWTGKYQLAVNPWEKDALTFFPGAGLTLAEETGLAVRADRPIFMPAASGGSHNPNLWYARAKDIPFARYELHARIQAPPPVKYRDLKEVVQVNIQYVNLPSEVRHDYFKLNDAESLVPVTVQVRNKDLTFKREGNVDVARVAVYGIVTSMTNKIITEFEDDFLVSYKPEFLQQGLTKLSMYQKILPLERRMLYKLDLVLKDLNSGHVGVIRKAIIPPSYGEEKLEASSLILSNSIQPMDTIPTKDEMFVLGDVKILPNMDKRFTQQMPLGVYFQVYNVALDQTTFTPSLRVIFKLLKSGELLLAATDESGESTQFFSGRRVVLVKKLSLAGLEPGKYRIQVEVVDRLTDRGVEVSDDFSVVQEDQAD